MLAINRGIRTADSMNRSLVISRWQWLVFPFTPIDDFWKSCDQAHHLPRVAPREFSILKYLRVNMCLPCPVFSSSQDWLTPWVHFVVSDHRIFDSTYDPLTKTFTTFNYSPCKPIIPTCMTLRPFSSDRPMVGSRDGMT